MPKTKRRLAAVMFTDIVDYSKLMNADESKAMELLNQHDKIAEDCFSDYNGKLIKKIGDADFIEFSSALDAVKCAINLQDRFKKRNQTTENIFDEINIRIGIHVGDIIEKEDDIFGDGVNIASRIVSIANGGNLYF
jgi:adenylate cyclase